MGNTVCCFAPPGSPRYGVENGGHQADRYAGTTAKPLHRTNATRGVSRSEKKLPTGERRLPKVVEKLEDTDVCRESGKGSAKSIENGDVSGKRKSGAETEITESPRLTDSSTQTPDLDEGSLTSAEGEETSRPEKLDRKKRVVGDSAMLLDCGNVPIVESPVREDGETHSYSEEENVEGFGSATAGSTQCQKADSKNSVTAALSDRTVRDVTNEMTGGSRHRLNSGEDAPKPVSNSKGRVTLLSVEVESQGSGGVVFEGDGESVTLEAVEDRGEVEERFYESSEMDTVEMLTSGEFGSSPPQYLMYSLEDVHERLGSLPLNLLSASSDKEREEEEDREERSFGTPRGRVGSVTGNFEDLKPARGSLRCHPLAMSDCTLLDSQTAIETEKSGGRMCS